MAVILFHLVIALAHTIFCVYRCTSSGCWDTIAELLILAQNSQPFNVPLRNTSAGIKRGRTFSKKAKIRTVRQEAGVQGEHVELVYEVDEEDQEEMLHGGLQDAEMAFLGPHKHRRTLSVVEVQKTHHNSDDSEGERAMGGIRRDDESHTSDAASMMTLKPMGSQQVQVRSRSSDTVRQLLRDGGRSSARQVKGRVQVDVKYV